MAKRARRRDAVTRVADVVGALLLIAASVPVMVLLALSVLVNLGRPFLFVQVRSGQMQQPFAMVKFRTMTCERDAAGELLSDHRRVTRFGRLLRRSRLDELPELWNVLKGDMSFIGPRPLLPETVVRMGDEGAVRSSVRPGLTGWAQISGNACLSNDDKLALDLWYICHRSLALDALIVLKTPGVMLFGERISAGRLMQAQELRRLV